jgi:branched-chain amino acid transport system substrate-binding protein
MIMRCRLAVFLPVLLGFMGCYTPSAPPPIVLGHVSDKTRLDKAGDQAELGIRLALHDLNKDGALAEAFGGRAIQVRHTDTRGQLDAFEAEAVRLDSVNRCLALFGGYSAPEANALNNAKIPLLTFYGQPVSGAGNQVFYLGMSPARQGAALAMFIADDLQAKKIVLLIDERRTESAVLANSFQSALAMTRKPDWGKTQAWRFGKDVKWNELVERTKSAQPSTVVFAGTVHDFNAWHKAFRKEFSKGQPQVLFAGDDGSERLFDLEGDPKSSIVLATAFHADPASEKITAFTKAYQEAFKTEADVNSALAYDAFGIMVEAMKRASAQLTPDRVREELLKTKDFPGLTGPLTVTAERQVLRPLFVVRWQNGAATALKTVAP